MAEVLARVCADPDAALKALGRRPDATLREEIEDARPRRQAEPAARRPDRARRVSRRAARCSPSKRLDAYLSVFKWTLQLAGIPVLPELVDFLGEVARRRADPDEIPGLAAQIPDSPLVHWLHAADAPIAGDLRVVAGDLAGRLGHVVAEDAARPTRSTGPTTTSSCRRGRCTAARRATSGASFVLDQGGTRLALQLLRNERTAAAIVSALVLDAEPRGLPDDRAALLGGRVLDRRPRARATQARRTADPAGGVRPAGILGSHLKVDGKTASG